MIFSLYCVLEIGKGQEKWDETCFGVGGYVSMYLCLSVGMYVCIYVCINIFKYMYMLCVTYTQI